jgi:hypothetical protein
VQSLFILSTERLLNSSSSPQRRYTSGASRVYLDVPPGILDRSPGTHCQPCASSRHERRSFHSAKSRARFCLRNISARASGDSRSGVPRHKNCRFWYACRFFALHRVVPVPGLVPKLINGILEHAGTQTKKQHGQATNQKEMYSRSLLLELPQHVLSWDPLEAVERSDHSRNVFAVKGRPPDGFTRT